ncbi:MAG TPA: hypothetical protein VFQ35_05930 [Polyangiaceae bacterium]|nr:hypothetical protein [Polyangiaceae bacterium]
MGPIFFIGALAIGALLLRPTKTKVKTLDEGLIDGSEAQQLANTERLAAARFQIQSLIAKNSISFARQSADYIEKTLGMPRTANNVRAYATMLDENRAAGGTAVAGEIGWEPAPPDWLKFHATQSKLGGDPAQIRATAETMRRYGYRRAARIHLRLLGES